MTQYEIKLIDPNNPAIVFGYEYITTDDSIEAYEWISDIEFDYTDYYGMYVLAEVTVY